MSTLAATPITEGTIPSKDATTITWRLYYAELGWHTFLVHGIQANGKCSCLRPNCKSPGKHPVFSGDDRGATVDPVRIRREGMKHPDANIAVHLGLSRLVCIDVDPRNGGNQTLADLEEQYERLDAAIVAETGGGGTHHFFRAPANATCLPSKGSLGPGIDVLHGTAYPVITPSVHRSGKTYCWREKHDPWEGSFLFSPLPEWMMEHGHRRDTKASVIISDEDYWATVPSVARAFEWNERSVARLCSALVVVPADERGAWLQVGAALHHASQGSEEGRMLWEEWSVGSDRFEGCPQRYDGEDQEQTWNGFDAKRVGALTVGSIFHKAKELGWVDLGTNAEPETLGDISNGRRFATQYRGLYLYVQASKEWLRWDGLRWGPCDSGQQMQAAKALADLLVHEGAEAFTRNPDEANKRRHGLALNVHRSLGRLHALLEAATTEPGMSVPSPSALDSNPLLLGVKNGVVDLRSGNLLTAEPGQRISKQAGASYNPNAECPRWETFLLQVFGPEEVVAFVQRLVGYTLTGQVDEEVLIFMYGTGANGKSVFANVIAALLGDYAVTVGTELLARNKSEGETARYKVKLQGSRLALANEVGQADTWDDQQVKEVTSREAIPARRLYGEAFAFMPTHKLWVRGNHQPTILDASEGMWRRLLLIPFARSFAPDEMISDLDRQLFEQEASGILNWALQGCLAWKRSGLSVPASISSARQEYRDGSDVLGQWLADYCVVKAGGRIGIGEAFASWRSFCIDYGISPGAQPTFTRRMKAHGVQYRKSNGKAFFEGIAMREVDAADDL